MKLRGKAAIVTGASRGLGREISLSLAEAGASICLVARDEAELAKVAKLATSAGAQGVLTIVADLSSVDEPARVVAETVEAFGSLDILVNNAGNTKRGDFLTLTDEDHLSGFALKYHATVRFCRSAWPHLVASQGSIVNISGIGAHTPEAEFTVGGPVNSAIINFSKALSKAAVSGFPRVNTICPGPILTDRLNARVAKIAEQERVTQPVAQEILRKQLGVDRFGEAKDIADAVLYLCLDSAKYVQGSVLTVDGGATPGI